MRLLLVDDQRLVRAGFRRLLEGEPDLEVVGEAADGVEAVEQVRRHRPDLVLMDIRMPRMDGITATRQLLGEHPATKVLILTTYDLDEYVYEALRAGASGFLLKDAPPELLLDAVRVLAAGDALLAPSVTRRLIAEFAARPVPSANRALSGLTQREHEVLRLVAQGETNGEIATRLYLGVATVKTHVANLLAKTGSRDRVHLVVLAYESGLIQPGVTG